MALAALNICVKVVEPFDADWCEASDVRKVLDFLRCQSNVLPQSQHVSLPGGSLSDVVLAGRRPAGWLYSNDKHVKVRFQPGAFELRCLSVGPENEMFVIVATQPE